MIQVEEKGGLGAGQRIETEMAKQVGIKVFHTYTDYSRFEDDDVDKISKKIQEWYQTGCANMDLENVYIGHDNRPIRRRPAYEKL